jgi:pyruvate formate lyase activating enzyme
MESRRPLIVDVARGRLEDGPGIRSVVFFKGCPLNCIFCQNPETHKPGVEVAFSPRRCILCGSCADACPESAIDLNVYGRIWRKRCIQCGKCASACPGGALKLIGRYYPVEKLAELLIRDNAFYRHSGGGVTLSGGECTMYPDYVEALLLLLKAEGIDIALETAGHFEYSVFERKILPHVDLIYYDIKIANSEAHIRYIGKSNERILRNLRRLLQESGVEVHPRVPLVPGITATKENLADIVDILCEAAAGDVTLLPYNPMGIEMSVGLGNSKPPLPERFMTPAEEEEILLMFENLLAEKGRPGLAGQRGCVSV